jgi:hypothetical protein
MNRRTIATITDAVVGSPPAGGAASPPPCVIVIDKACWTNPSSGPHIRTSHNFHCGGKVFPFSFPQKESMIANVCLNEIGPY